MPVAGAARLLVQRTLWQAIGLPSAGRALVQALGSDDETVRTMAGMSLIQGGQRALPLLREALARRENLPKVLPIIGDIGDPSFEPDLERLARDADPTVRGAAREGLRVLQARLPRP